MSNLLSKTEKKEIKKLYYTRLLAVGFLILGFVALAGSALILPTLLLTKSNERVLTERTNSLASKETTGLEKSLSATVADINTRLSVFDTVTPKSPLIGTVINSVLNAKSSAITIQQITTSPIPKKSTDIAVVITGIAKDRESLLAFSGRLQKIEGLSNVTVPISSFLKNSNMSFTINLNALLK